MLHRIFKLFIYLSIIGFLAVAAIIYHYSRELPSHSDLKNYYPPLVTRIYSSDGILIQEYSKENRVFVPIESVPKSVIEAFIAAEDSNFYSHPGFDIRGIIRAFLNNMSALFLGGTIHGGSTITQQVVRNFLLTSDKSLERKIKEILLSWKATKILTKDQILELYLNQIFLGRNSYGIGAASQNYFNKSVEELTIEEAAFLAGIPQAPSRFNPSSNYQKAFERRNYVLRRMEKEGFIAKHSAKKYSKKPIQLFKRQKAQQILAPYYAQQVRSKVIEMLGAEYFYNAGLTIISCMDSSMQQEAKKSLRKGVRKYDNQTYYRGPVTNIDINNITQQLMYIGKITGMQEYTLAAIIDIDDSEKGVICFSDGEKSPIDLSQVKWPPIKEFDEERYQFQLGDVVIVEDLGNKKFAVRQIPEVNGAIMAIQPQTGKVLAMEGGYDFEMSNFNRATKAKRQPGSAIKPFVYLAALENGFRPNDIFLDSEVNMGQGYGLEIWQPKNDDAKFLGPITLRRGLEKSRNLITMKVSQKVGINKITEIINRFGISKNPPAFNSLSLGAVETTLENITTAYAIIANNGQKVTPHYIEVIKDRNGKIIYQRDQRQCVLCNNLNEIQLNNVTYPMVSIQKERMITDRASNYQIASMLEGAVTRGTGWRAQALKKIVAAKTGTTNDSFDAWFIGFTPNIAVGTFVGFDNPRTLGEEMYGSNVAGPIFVNFMKNAYKTKSLPMKVPDTIQAVRINPDSGMPERGEHTIKEYFKVSDIIEGLGHNQFYQNIY